MTGWAQTADQVPRVRRIFAWGSKGVVVQYRDRWEVRDWVSLAVAATGGGTACPEPEGERLAVIRADGTISVAGKSPALPPGSLEVAHAAWLGDGLAAVTTRSPGDDGRAASHSAREFDAPPAHQPRIWQLTLDGAPPVPMVDLSPGSRVSSLTTGNAEAVIVETYRPATREVLPERRLLVVPAEGEAHDLAPELSGATCDVAFGPQQEIALLQSDPEYPPWYSLVVGRDGAWQRVLPRELRIWGAPAWCPDRRLLTVTVFRGIRLGVVAVDMEEARWRWLATDEAASYRAPAVCPGGGDVLCVRRSIDREVELLRLSDSERVTGPLSEPEAHGTADNAVVRRWSRPEGELEGVFVAPTTGDGAPWPLVVDLHGGPVGGLIAGEHSHLRAWCDHGFAAFAPDYRTSGILGREPMLAGFRGDGLAETDAVADDVLSGIESLVAEGIADEAQLFLFGHSWGAYLVNRIVTRDHRFRAAICWEGVADLRLLDSLAGGSAMHRAWQGGSPREVPERWKLASPIDLADRVRTPMLLVYGDDSELLTAQGLAWYTALRDHDLPCALVFYRGEGHVLSRPENRTDLLTRSASWFRQHG